jgi:hypothetical protein
VDALDASWRRVVEQAGGESLGDCPDRNGTLRIEFEEMLISELLLRAWTAYVYLGQDRPGNGIARPSRVASALTTTILHQRRRMLLAILKFPSLAPFQQRLDRTRRVVERWNDVLLSGFPKCPAASLLRFDDARSADYATMWTSPPADQPGREPIMIAAMRAAIPSLPLVNAGRAESLRDLFRAVLNCVEDDPLDGSGAQSRRRQLIERCGLA